MDVESQEVRSIFERVSNLKFYIKLIYNGGHVLHLVSYKRRWFHLSGRFCNNYETKIKFTTRYTKTDVEATETNA